MLTRRNFIRGLLATPTVITTPGLLMPVKQLFASEPPFISFYSHLNEIGYQLAGQIVPVGPAVSYTTASSHPLSERWAAHIAADNPGRKVTLVNIPAGDRGRELLRQAIWPELA